MERKLVQHMSDDELVEHFHRMVAVANQTIPDANGRGLGNIAKLEAKADVAKKEILKRLGAK